jgi:hypothetical protein
VSYAGFERNTDSTGLSGASEACGPSRHPITGVVCRVREEYRFYRSVRCFGSRWSLPASNNWCRTQGLRKKKDGTCLPGATSEKWILTSNKRCYACAGCARGDRGCGPAWCHRGRGFLLAFNNWCRMHGLRRKKGATNLPGATSEKGILTSNKRCHVQGVRGETGAAGLPGTTGEKGILTSNKRCYACGGCAGGDRRCGPAWCHRGRGFLLAFNNWCRMHGLRRKKGATNLPGATSEKWILAPNKRCHACALCRVCEGRQVLRACLAPQGRRGIFTSNKRCHACAGFAGGDRCSGPARRHRGEGGPRDNGQSGAAGHEGGRGTARIQGKQKGRVTVFRSREFESGIHK